MELIVVIFVVTVGIIAVYRFSANIISDVQSSNSKATAIYLSQEGIEIVKNIRDTNYIIDYTANGLASFESGPQQADYLSTSLQPYISDFLKINDNGFYNYVSGSPTKFTREINLIREGDIISIISTVYWNEKGQPKDVSVKENIYNWYGLSE